MTINPVTWPALLKVLTCFLLVVGANRFKLNLGIALAASGTLLGLWMGMGPVDLLKNWGHALSASRTLSLVAVVILILGLSRLMKESGQLDRIVSRFAEAVRSPALTSAVMPALIGLLPMPGGALFSAPMVESACPLQDEEKPDGALLASINYWFRHHGEYWWPLYPGVILAVSLLNLPTWVFVAGMAPLALVHIAAGAVFLLPRLGKAPRASSEKVAGSWMGFVKEITPILIVVGAIPATALALGGLAWAGVKLSPPPGMAVLLGLILAIIWTVVKTGLSFKRLGTYLVSGETWAMGGLVLGVMIFQTFMVQSGAVSNITRELNSLGIPALAVVILLPFLSGLVTGIAVGYVAASFPLVLPLFSHLSGAAFLAHGGLAFISGFIGMLLSPVHLCFLVSKDYFKTGLPACYRYIALPLAVVALALAVWFLVLNRI